MVGKDETSAACLLNAAFSNSLPLTIPVKHDGEKHSAFLGAGWTLNIKPRTNLIQKFKLMGRDLNFNLNI